MPTSICPECSEEVYVEADCEQGDIVTCDECGSRLEVAGLDPVELDLRAEEDAVGIGDDDFESLEYDE